MLSIVALIMLAAIVLGALAFLGGLACMIVFIVRKCTSGAGGVSLLVTSIVLMAAGLVVALAPVVLLLLVPGLF